MEFTCQFVTFNLSPSLVSELPLQAQHLNFVLDKVSAHLVCHGTISKCESLSASSVELEPPFVFAEILA